MIKLSDLLNEMSLKPKKWMPIPSSELDDFKQEIVDLIQTAYKNVPGGNPVFAKPSDVNTERNKMFSVIDVDADDDLEAVVVSKQQPAGKKFVALGHDGTSQGKRAAIGRQVSQLKKKGHFVEVSGKIADILKSAGVPVVDDEETVRKALRGKEIKWNGDGTYERDIPKIGKKTKILMGKPKV